MNEHIQLKVSIFDAVEPVLVRPGVTVDTLFQDILREFAGELDLQQRYSLLCNNAVLPSDVAVGELGLPDDAILRLAYFEADQAVWSFGTVQSHQRATSEVLRLREPKTDTVFIIEAFPAVVGRHSPRDAEALGADLSTLPGGDTVSRRHARITRDDQGVAITRLEKTNPLLINGTEIPIGVSRKLPKECLLQFGEIELHAELSV